MNSKKCKILAWIAMALWIATFIWFIFWDFPHIITALSVGDVIPADDEFIRGILEAVFIYPIEPLILFYGIHFFCKNKKRIDIEEE